MSEGDNPNIDFITDVDLRKSLESDINELELCRKSRAWKPVVVLVGSITEALLIDSVVALGIESKEKALKLSLSEAIDKCLTASVLSQKTADLSSVIKEYRNLIHPGRLLRLKEKVDAESASVANSLLRMVIREIGEKR